MELDINLQALQCFFGENPTIFYKVTSRSYIIKHPAKELLQTAKGTRDVNIIKAILLPQGINKSKHDMIGLNCSSGNREQKIFAWGTSVVFHTDLSKICVRRVQWPDKKNVLWDKF